MSGLVTYLTSGPGSPAGIQAGLPSLSLFSLSLFSLFTLCPVFSSFPSSSLFYFPRCLLLALLWFGLPLVPDQDPGRLLGPSPAPAISQGFGSACQLLSISFGE